MEPTEPPPPYQASSSSAPPKPTHLEVPHKTRNGIPPSMRRSMEDEARPLPANWVRQYDSKSHHQFFVDTSTSPPRSIWHHPYDDETYLSSLSPEERERVQSLHPVPSRADIEAESSGDDEGLHFEGSGSGSGGGGYHAQKEEPPKGMHKFGRKMKDKLTSSTHEEREAARLKREEEEREAYRQHLHIRQQMSKAAETGEPQLLGKDRQGRDVYIEPPAGPGGFGGGYGGGGYGNGYGYNPYNQGPYANPNVRFIRPQNPYARPYGMGYGGGYGLPLVGGLTGGLLLGGLLF